MSEKQFFLELSVFPKCQSWIKANKNGWELVLFHVPRPFGVVVLNKDDLSVVRDKLEPLLIRLMPCREGERQFY